MYLPVGTFSRIFGLGSVRIFARYRIGLAPGFSKHFGSTAISGFFLSLKRIGLGVGSILPLESWAGRTHAEKVGLGSILRPDLLLFSTTVGFDLRQKIIALR
jgi:hypothetical protein